MLLRLLDVLVCLSVCHALRDTFMVLHELFVGLTCSAWCAGLTSLCARRCPALVISLIVDTSVLRVCSASVCGVDSHRSFSNRARHSCSSDAAATAALVVCLMVSGHFSTQTCSFCLTGQRVWWGLPCTCARHTKCSRLTVRSRFSVVRSFRRAVLAPSSHLLWGILTCFWMICFFLRAYSWDARPLVSSASSIGLHTGGNSCCSVCCPQDSSVSQVHISV